jgi:hypothetical protein
MALRKEWTEWHLTPRGWERGATRVQGRGNHWTPEPEDRVASWVYSETETSVGLRRHSEPTWDNKLAAQVNELLTRFGPCPEEL